MELNRFYVSKGLLIKSPFFFIVSFGTIKLLMELNRFYVSKGLLIKSPFFFIVSFGTIKL